MIKPVYLEDNVLFILDQRRLPAEEVWIECTDVDCVANAIKTLAVRGAPAIGIAAAYGFYIGLKNSNVGNYSEFVEYARGVKEKLASTRPTAFNLFWALDRVWSIVLSGDSIDDVVEKVRQEALKIHEEDIRACKNMAEHAFKEIFSDFKDKKKLNILTHCNAGAIATGGYGTALGIIRKLFEEGVLDTVFVDETRPLLQGARLTAWELKKEGIPYRIITDNMAGFLMLKGMIDAVVVGADRITLRGDVANKIGTYTLSVLARRHHIPFIVAAPCSTVDLSIYSMEEIPIEERDETEVLTMYGDKITPEGSKACNFAFDTTPAELISYIVTEKGVLKYPFVDLRVMCSDGNKV